MATVLIIEDDPLAAVSLAWIIEDMGHVVLGPVPSGDEAETLALSAPPDIILSDISILGERDGIDVVKSILEKAESRVIFITANTEPHIHARARELNPGVILNKPYTPQQIGNAVLAALSTE